MRKRFLVCVVSVLLITVPTLLKSQESGFQRDLLIEHIKVDMRMYGISPEELGMDCGRNSIYSAWVVLGQSRNIFEGEYTTWLLPATPKTKSNQDRKPGQHIVVSLVDRKMRGDTIWMK